MRNPFPGAVLLLSLLVACPALAQPGVRWLEVRTPHFTVMTNASEKDARHVASQFERMRQVFQIIMPTAKDDPASPIVVLALKDRKSFAALEPAAYLAKNQLQLAGLFVRAQQRNYVLLRLDAEGDHPFATVYHEYTHYMFRKYDAWLPLWLNEGLAEFYQNTQLQDRDVRIGQPSEDDILYLRQNKLLPLTTLLAVDHDSPYYHDEEKGSVFYAEAWALTHFIEMTDKVNKTSRLQDYAKYLQQHEDPVTAAQHAFGDLGKLQKQLDAYVSQSEFKEFHLITPIEFPESSFTVREVPAPEADAVRGGVLLSVRRTQEAESVLQSALQADPTNALAHETMGELKISQNDVPAAKKWFTEAVKLDSRSYLAHYYFAVMSLQANDRDHDEAIEQSLKTSIQLNPRFAPSYDALANFYASRHEKLDEAHRMNMVAVELEPESLPYRMNAAGVLAENQQMEGAISVLKAAMPYAKTPEEKAMVSGQMAQMDQYRTALAQASSGSQVRQQPSASDDGSVVVTMDIDGRPSSLPAHEKDPEYPAGAPTGPHHTVSGVLRSVKCAYPTVLTLTLDRPKDPVVLYTNNYFKVEFTTTFNSSSDISPCSNIEGMKAKVVYGEVADSRVAGQIIAIELSR